jgi:thioredoxin 2
MADQSVIVRCPKCGTRNRVPRERWGEQPRCGKCKETLDPSHLFPDASITVSDATFRQEVASFPGPVLVDFTAPW